MVDKDMSTAYAILTAAVSALFDVNLGVFFCVIAGSFLSLRFCTTKTTGAALYHLAFSIVIVSIIMGELLSNQTILPNAKLIALAGGFLFMLVAEMIYGAVKTFNLGAKLNLIWDRLVDKWTR